MDFFKEMVEEKSIKRNVTDAISRLIELCKPLSTSDYSILRQSLLQFFQDRKIKVSVFLQEKIQSKDGFILMGHQGSLPVGAEIPGIIRYFDEEENLVNVEKVTLKNQQGVSEAKKPFNIFKPDIRYSKLGFNMYKKKNPKPQRNGGIDKRMIIQDDLNQFAKIMGTHREKKKVDEKVSINFFSNKKESKEVDIMVRFDAEQDKHLSNISHHLDTVAMNDSNENDLLDLMDGL